MGGAEQTEGMNYLNELIANRTPNAAMRVNSAADFTIERIMKERRKELVGEGLIFYDYLRNRIPIVRSGRWHLATLKDNNAITIQYNDLRIALPIPQSEINRDPQIVQNPGW